MQRRLEPIAKTNHNKSTNSLGTNEIAGNFNVSKNLNEFDCTSIASISESSHWSGNNDDLDNIALVNGSENALEDKDWSTYLRLSKNTFNSSDDDDADDNDVVDDGFNANSPNKAKPIDTNELSNEDNTENTEEGDVSTNKNKKSTAKMAGNSEDTENDDEPSDEDILNDEEDDEDDDEDDDQNNDDDDLDDDNIWTIKPKLLRYYEEQFKTMQSNLNGYITGSVARPFFEKSKLPLNELSKIWELADTNGTGALTFSQFCTAMHLVVLRVRNFELPDRLPLRFQPYVPLIDLDSEVPVTNTEVNSMPNTVTTSETNAAMQNYADPTSTNTASPTSKSPVKFSGANFIPVKFQFNPDVQSDLVHPIALRVLSNHQAQPQTPPRHSRSSSLGSITNRNQPPAVPPRDQSQNEILHVPEANTDIAPTLPPLPPPLPPHPPLPTHQQSTKAQLSLTQDQIENLIDQMHSTNIDHKKKLCDQAKQSDNKKLQLNEINEKIKQQNEYNQKLKKIFNDLEKEYRHLTDTRIALEIKHETLTTPMSSSISTTTTNPLSSTTPVSATSTTTTATSFAITHSSNNTKFV